MAVLVKENEARISSAVWPHFACVFICSAAALEVSGDVFLL